MFTTLNPIPETIRIGKKLRNNKSRLKTLANVSKWVVSNIEYKTDIRGYKVLEYFATPIETLKNSFGDCEDRGILAISILAGTGQFKPDELRLALGKYITYNLLPALITRIIVKSMFGGSVRRHAWAEAKVNGKWYVCDGGKVYKFPHNTYRTEVQMYRNKVVIKEVI